MERFACTRVKDLSTFILFVIAQRGLDIHETEVHINIDKGGDLLKMTAQILQEEEVEGEPLSSGVKKALPVCTIAKINESHEVVEYMYESTNAKDVEYVDTDDFKVDNIVCGLQTHMANHPCYLCKAHRKDFCLVHKPTRYVKCFFEDHANYKEFCVGKTENQKKQAAKDFFNVKFYPLLPKDKWDQPVRRVVKIDELHLLQGNFMSLFNACKEVFISIVNWARKCNCKSQGYHGGVFTGGDVKKLLENVDILYNMARDEVSFVALRFVEAFRALNAVRIACFSTKLRENWSEALDHYQYVVTDLIQDPDIKLNCTTKIHVLFWHVREECEDQVEKNPDDPNGLGRDSTQTGESAHNAFGDYLERFSPCWNNVEILNDQLFRATTSWSSKCLWPKRDEAGDAQN